MCTWKKYLILALALVMSLSLMACGGSDSIDSGDDSISVPPDSFEGMVQDSELQSDYATYWGVWVGEDGSELSVAKSDDEVRFELWSGNDLTASGYIQYDQSYGADYFYNEHDGMAYRSVMDADGTLQIDTLGTFSYVSDVDGGTGDTASDDASSDAGDLSALTGDWYLDGQADASSIITFYGDGSWTLYERLDGDSDPAEVDSGTLRVNPDDETAYFADSTVFDDVSYDVIVADNGILYWGGEYDCYWRVQ